MRLQGWTCVGKPNHDIHVVPINDLKEHIQIGLECWCHPKMIIEDLGDLRIIVHASADGRELIEEHGVN